jgi:anti-anti-sigma factor
VATLPDNNLVALDGEWDLSRKDELKALLAGLSVKLPAVIDIRGLTYLDSTVLSLLGALSLRFHKTGVTLLGPNANVLRLLKLMRFDTLFSIVNDQTAS